MKSQRLKWLLGRLPLPMLALAASHGVYSFGTLYMPWYFALISAAAFELTYCGLAVAELHSDEERKRARNISIGAVAVSILYNAVAAYFHRNRAILDAMAWYAEVALALLHAAPLATVAYLVASLLLHSEPQPEATTQLEIAPESRNVAQPGVKVIEVMRSRPSRMRPQLPPPTSATMPRAVASADKVDAWIARNDAGETYADISRSLGGKPSRAYISAQCNARRAQLAQPVE